MYPSLQYHRILLKVLCALPICPSLLANLSTTNLFLFTKLEISEPWIPWIKKMFSHSSLHREGYRSGVQVSPLEVALDVLFGQVDASRLLSGHLRQSWSARGIMMGNAGRVGERLNWSTHPSWVSG